MMRLTPEREANLLRTIGTSLPMSHVGVMTRQYTAVYDGILSVRVTDEQRDSIEQTLIMLRQARETLGEADG